MQKKICLDCQKNKKVSEFYPRYNGKYYSYCKKCVKKRVRKWDLEHPDRRREINREEMQRHRRRETDRKIVY